jgi:hypothetical protein
MPVVAGDRLVEFNLPRRHRYGFPILTGLAVVICAGLVVTDSSWETRVPAAATIGLFAWIWATIVAARRARGSAVNAVVLTTEGISSPLFTLEWERVARAWIGSTSPETRGMRALFVEPVRPSDVRMASSGVLAANRWLEARTRRGRLQFLQSSVDLPLEELLDEMEQRAGRRLT